MQKTKKQQKKNDSKTIFILSFIITFTIAALLIGAALKNFSPTVDVNIGQNDLQSEYSGADTEIDDRLKWIQDEDNLTPTSEKYLQAESNNITQPEDTDTQTENEDIPKEAVIPVPEKKEVIKPSNNNVVKTPPIPQREEIPIPINNKIITKAPVPTLKEIQQTPTVNNKTSKVYVGFYDNLDDAVLARKNISRTIPGIQPFVKSVNGQYIVQAGSFSDRLKAVELQEQLNKRGYDAKLITN